MKKGILSCVSIWLTLNLFSLGIFSAYADTQTTPVVTTPDSRRLNAIEEGTQPPAIKQYPSVSVPAATITNEQYDSLPVCPAAPVCPDINGNMANGSPPTTSPPITCPNSCTVTRQVTFADPNDTTSQILSTQPAVCPPGYVGSGVYKMGQEIVQTTTKEAAPFPIPSMATYNGYIKGGYDCSEGVPQQTAAYQCYFNDYAKFGGEVIQLINGYVGYYYNYEGQQSDGSYKPLWGPTAPVQRYLISSNCGTNQTDPNGYYYISYNVSWKYIKCYRMPGSLYYTANMTPTAIVCTVAKPTWNTAH